jgi:competence protein ComEC
MAADESQAPAPARLMAALARLIEAEQGRWFFWVPVLIGAGTGGYFALASEPHVLAALAPLLAALGLWALRPRAAVAMLAVSALVAVTAGFALAKLRVEWVRAPVLAKEMRAVEVAGFLELVEPRPGGAERLTLRVTALGDLAREDLPVRVRITNRKATAGLRPGMAVRMRGTLMPPSQPALPGGYDFGRYAWFQQLGAVGYTWRAPEPDAAAGAAPWEVSIWTTVERLRQTIGARIRAVLPGERGAVANALITGERGGITEATNDAFRDSGLVHILSISGLHMAIMAGTVFFVVRAALAAVPVLALNYPIKKWAAGAAMLAALGYLLISGTSFATVRSTIMISIMFLAVLLDRPAVTMRNVVLAALVILLLFPESLLDVGFQMSFAAVLALVAVYEALRGRGWSLLPKGPWSMVAVFFAGIVLSTLIASAAVAPFGAFHFHKSQQYAVLANLIALPICNLVVMPAALATLVAMPLGLEAVPLWVMGHGIDAMVWTAQRVSRLPGAVLAVPAMPTGAFLLMVAGSLWLALWRTRWRMLGVAMIGAGLGLAPTLRLPDVLVGKDGKLVAVRGADGRLSAMGSARAFELQRWLDYDGDRRAPEEAAKAAGFFCDGVGCSTRVKGLTLAVAKHPAAFGDDCRSARILASGIVSPRRCPAPGVVVDFFAARYQGTHAIYVGDDGTLRVETVEANRGKRPWSAPPRAPKRRRGSAQ